MIHLKELGNSVAEASKWAFLGELVAKLLAPATFLILARILSPDDFGVAAAVMLVITFSQLLWEAGMGKAVIQHPDRVNEVAGIALWTNLGLAVLIYSLVLFTADIIAEIFGDARIAAVIRLQGVQILLMALGSVHRALLQRALNFKRLFWVRLVTTGVPGLASIPLALGGWGYWALVVGSLVGALAEVIVLWRQSTWRPTLKYDHQLAPVVFKFGLWVMGEGLLLWLIAWSDAFLVGRYFGTEALGFYRGGATLVSVVFTLALSPVLPVLFSALSRLQSDTAAFRLAYLKAVQVISMVALPLSAGFIILKNDLVIVSLGADWLPAAPVVGLLGLMHGISWLVGANPEAYRALGRPDINMKINAFNLTYYIPALVWAVHADFITFLYVRAGLAFIALPVHVWLSKTLLSVTILDLLARVRWSVIAVIIQTIVILIILQLLPSDTKPGIVLLATIGFGGCAFVLGLWPERSFLRGLARRFA